MIITKEILFEYFFGRVTTVQKEVIEEWKKKPENEDFFFACLEEWENSYPQHRPNEAAALERYKRFMLEMPPQARQPNKIKVQPLNTIQRKPSQWYWMAAAAVLLPLIFMSLWQVEYFYYQTYTTQFGETKTIILADQSQVVLNAHSTLKVPRDMFAAGAREVWLTGEGFFNIAKHPIHQKFLVHTDKLDIEVLGTKFNVSDRRGSARIVLEEGKVKVTPVAVDAPEREEALVMHPGESIEVTSARRAPVKKYVKPELYTAWRENKLIFEQTPLFEVLQTIEDYYGIQFVVEDSSLSKEQFTGVLPNNDLGVILKSLSRTYGFTIYREEQTVRLQ
ncbi:FecR domain-containing protein [Rhodocytophaga aerolata]|uniref:FecR domain-containing protein n=1 Tax=Rhodocytophaga aerolata TaxID=455078 RepID=A0ABT8RJQ4_9BACT|nr:FecR domain-containing protein [Rhodocytophaga aerolata]MDO1451195.1 FecR domain-containing protein [Rhodocytophaga aerolata]